MEARINLTGAILLLVLGVVAVFWSKLIASPLGVIALWFAVSLFINSYRLFGQADAQSEAERKSSLPKKENPTALSAEGDAENDPRSA